MGQTREEPDDGGHLGHGREGVVGVPRVAEVIADPMEELVVVRGALDAALEIPQVLDEQVTGEVLANLEVLAAGVDAAEDPGKPGHQEECWAMWPQTCSRVSPPSANRLKYSERRKGLRASSSPVSVSNQSIAPETIPHPVARARLDSPRAPTV